MIYAARGEGSEFQSLMLCRRFEAGQEIAEHFFYMLIGAFVLLSQPLKGIEDGNHFIIICNLETVGEHLFFHGSVFQGITEGVENFHLNEERIG